MLEKPEVGRSEIRERVHGRKISGVNKEIRRGNG